MKRTRLTFIILLLAATALDLSSAAVAFELGSQVIAGGGGLTAAGGYSISGIVGQGHPVGPAGATGEEQLYAGFAYTTGGTLSDSDNDGVVSLLDNCPEVANATQADANANGIGDLCDTGSDTDQDGIADPFDNCPVVANAPQSDRNGNGTGDACEDADSDGVFDLADVCPGFNDRLDADGDALPDGCDNCMFAYNPNQRDNDADGVGNACELAHTPFSASYFGYVRVDNVPAAAGGEIAVYDPGGVLCGYDVVRNPGSYGFMAVYGDDPATPGDEGAVANDRLTFMVRDALSGLDLRARPVLVSGGLPWADMGSSQVDLLAFSEIEVRIPLRAGWNLVSFPLAVAWHVGAAPAVPLADGVEPVPVTSIGELFASIAGKYTAIRSYDVAGVHTYAPDLPPVFNNLNYLAGGYGYWIKATEAVDLVLHGPPMLETDALPLQAGWNLVGCWADDVSYTGTSPPAYAYPYGATFTPVATISDILGSLGNRLTLLRGFDAAGANTYDPAVADGFNTLRYMGAGYGYWVKVTETATLDYGDQQ